MTLIFRTANTNNYTIIFECGKYFIPVYKVVKVDHVAKKKKTRCRIRVIISWKSAHTKNMFLFHEKVDFKKWLHDNKPQIFLQFSPM